MDKVALDGWTSDERFSPYPEGSRDKYAVIAPAASTDDCVVAYHRYLMKFSNPRYPVQFWSEIIAGIVGRHCGVPVPDCFYAEDPSSGKPGSLISWFYGENVEDEVVPPPPTLQAEMLEDLPAAEEAPESHSLYVPGSSYMARRIPDYDMKKGRQHNLGTLRVFITALRRNFSLDFWPHWAEVLSFDSLIGNTDRHQDNWGVLWRRLSNNSMVPRFSPAFDNGTSLLHEITEENLTRFEDSAHLERYVRRGTHHIKIALEDEHKAKHFDLLAYLVGYREDLRASIEQVVSYDHASLRDEIHALCDHPSEVPLSTARAQVICTAIERRRNIIQEEILS